MSEQSVQRRTVYAYRPSNGTEGESFIEDWCGHCARDAKYRDGGPDADPADGCPIVAATYAFNIDDERYPTEWTYGPEGRPKCTAYTEDPSQPLRCDKTIDLFGETP